MTCLTASNEVSATGCANSGPSLYEYTRVMIRLWVTISEPQSAVCRRRPAPRGGGLRGGGSEGGGLRGGGPATLLELYGTTVILQSVVPLHGPPLELCRTSMRECESEVVCI